MRLLLSGWEETRKAWIIHIIGVARNEISLAHLFEIATERVHGVCRAYKISDWHGIVGVLSKESGEREGLWDSGLGAKRIGRRLGRSWLVCVVEHD